jgi:hypothetical protein
LNANISVMYCPSDGARWSSSELAKTSYRACTGDLPIELDGFNWGHRYIRGIFTTGRNGGSTTFSSLSDGTSSTLLFSESCIGDGSRNIKSATPTAVYEGGNAQISSDEGPIACLQFRDTLSPKSYKADVIVRGADSWWELKGMRTFVTGGDARFTAFFSALPPNSPWCYNGWNMAYISASSNHPGGVNIARCDASGAFISDTVSCSTSGMNGQSQSPFTSPIDNVPWGSPYGGRSPYGVWGAMGSKAGGESTSL